MLTFAEKNYFNLQNFGKIMDPKCPFAEEFVFCES